MHIYMHMHVYTWTNFPHILPVNDKVCIASYQYSNLKHLTIVEQIHCNLGEVFFWSAWIALPFLLDKKLMQRASDQASWKCACRTESPPHECFYLILLFHKNATCGRNTTAEEIDNSEQGNKARWDVFWCPDQSKRFFFLVQSATTSAVGRLAGQQQPLSLAGRNAPRGWQAARTIWLVLLLLKTGWKCIACAGSHCCSCC